MFRKANFWSQATMRREEDRYGVKLSHAGRGKVLIGDVKSRRRGQGTIMFETAVSNEPARSQGHDSGSTEINWGSGSL